MNFSLVHIIATISLILSFTCLVPVDAATPQHQLVKRNGYFAALLAKYVSKLLNYAPMPELPEDLWKHCMQKEVRHSNQNQHRRLLQLTSGGNSLVPSSISTG
jgi:SET domain-containing protein